MIRIIALVGLMATLVTLSACSKPTTAPTTPAGPALNPPAQPVSQDRYEAAPAAEETKVAAIGAPGAAWANLEGTDGKMHSLSDLADAQVVAVVFTCNKCPVAVAYEDRLMKFAEDYKDKGVALVAINVNNAEADKLPAMKERAEEKGFNFAYLYDPSQESARAYGAAVTPHAFVLDKSRNVVYMGAIDDNWEDEAAVTNHSLRDAVEAAMAGKTPEVAQTDAVGCGIQYE
jgi:peroxiredoxin